MNGAKVSALKVALEARIQVLKDDIYRIEFFREKTDSTIQLANDKKKELNHLIEMSMSLESGDGYDRKTIFLLHDEEEQPIVAALSQRSKKQQHRAYVNPGNANVARSLMKNGDNLKVAVYQHVGYVTEQEENNEQ
jgi:hypothetical protein